jgi:hypothetical protein
VVMAQPPDLSEIRGEIRQFRDHTTRMFNAMREDLGDLRSRVGGLESRVDHLESRVEEGFARVDNGFAEMRGKFDAAAAGQQQIVELLNTLIAREGDQ